MPKLHFRSKIPKNKTTLKLQRRERRGPPLRLAELYLKKRTTSLRSVVGIKFLQKQWKMGLFS